jgi:hypothetical protein
MKLVRYRSLGAEKPGIVERVGALRDVSAHLGRRGGGGIT